MRHKLAVILNGRPGVGKDSLCDAVIKRGGARKVSSIDPILALARQGGWDGVKNAAGRKLLSDLKRAFAEYNDLPNRYILEACKEFLQSEDDILFVHIRESDQIDAFRRAAGDTPCVTLLVRRPGAYTQKMGNPSDDGTDECIYDFVFDNDQTLPQSEEAFFRLIRRLYESHAH